MGWSMDRQGIRTLFDRVTGRLKQFELSGPRRERVSLDTYSDELAQRLPHRRVARPPGLHAQQRGHGLQVVLHPVVDLPDGGVLATAAPGPGDAPR